MAASLQHSWCKFNLEIQYPVFRNLSEGWEGCERGGGGRAQSPANPQLWTSCAWNVRVIDLAVHKFRGISKTIFGSLWYNTCYSCLSILNVCPQVRGLMFTWSTVEGVVESALGLQHAVAAAVQCSRKPALQQAVECVSSMMEVCCINPLQEIWRNI